MSLPEGQEVLFMVSFTAALVLKQAITLTVVCFHPLDVADPVIQVIDVYGVTTWLLGPLQEIKNTAKFLKRNDYIDKVRSQYML